MLGRTLSHYRIIDKVGEGGMGVVYKAWDTRLNRPVALKILAGDAMADAERKQRFRAEAETASALNHPNIVHIYDIGTAEGADFIIMEFVEGKSLDELIRRKRLIPKEALSYAIQITDALAAAHNSGIVHRDIKPANSRDRGRHRYWHCCIHVA